MKLINFFIKYKVRFNFDKAVIKQNNIGGFDLRYNKLRFFSDKDVSEFFLFEICNRRSNQISFLVGFDVKNLMFKIHKY